MVGFYKLLRWQNNCFGDQIVKFQMSKLLVTPDGRCQMIIYLGHD